MKCSSWSCWQNGGCRCCCFSCSHTCTFCILCSASLNDACNEVVVDIIVDVLSFPSSLSPHFSPAAFTTVMIGQPTPCLADLIVHVLSPITIMNYLLMWLTPHDRLFRLITNGVIRFWSCLPMPMFRFEAISCRKHFVQNNQFNGIPIIYRYHQSIILLLTIMSHLSISSFSCLLRGSFDCEVRKSLSQFTFSPIRMMYCRLVQCCSIIFLLILLVTTGDKV